VRARRLDVGRLQALQRRQQRRIRAGGRRLVGVRGVGGGLGWRRRDDEARAQLGAVKLELAEGAEGVKVGGVDAEGRVVALLSAVGVVAVWEGVV
jgi:hypothetical protein